MNDIRVSHNKIDGDEKDRQLYDEIIIPIQNQNKRIPTHIPLPAVRRTFPRNPLRRAARARSSQTYSESQTTKWTASHLEKNGEKFVDELMSNNNNSLL